MSTAALKNFTIPQVKQKLKVAVVITRLICGGAQRIALESLAGLNQDHFDGTLICGPETGAEQDLFGEAEERGIKVVLVDSLGREIQPKKDAHAFIQLYKIFKSEQFDVVHSHTSKAGLLASTAARFARIPHVVYSPHGHIFGSNAQVPGVSDSGALKKFLLLKMRRWAQRCAHKTLALNNLDLQEQIELGLGPAHKYEVLRNGIDLQSYRPVSDSKRQKIRQQFQCDKEDFVIATVGRLSSEKGHDLLLQALNKLDRKEVVLWMIGDGALRDELEGLSTKLSGLARVRFLGMRQDVPELLAASDLMALPSRYESQGLVFMEAMAAGTPVIGPDVGGVPEVIRHEKTGLLIPPENAQALSLAIERMMDNPELRQQCSEQAKRLAASEFGIEKMLSQLEELYHSKAKTNKS